MAVLGTALAAGWTERLALSSEQGRGPSLEIEARGPLPARAPAFRVVVRTMRARLLADPAVAAVRERRLRRGAASTVLLVRFRVGGQGRDAAIARIERDLDPGPLTVSFGGPAAAVRIAKEEALDTVLPLLLCLPLVALISAGMLGVRPSGAALLAAAAAAALAALACELAGEAFDVYWLALVGALAGGTLVTLQLCAMARRGATAGAVWGSATAAAAAFGATALLDVEYLASLGLGGALGSLLAAPASLAAMGAAAGWVPSERSDRPSESRDPAAVPWRALAGLLGFSPVIGAAISLLGIALLLMVAAPADRLATAAIAAPAAPAIGAAEISAAIAAAALVTLGVGWAAGGRAGLAFLAAIVSALPALATAGLLVVSFQEGWLEDALGYTSSGAVQLGSLVAAVSVVAALGAAQAVALAAFARRPAGEAYAVDRVMDAIGRCGPAATLACLAGVAAGVAIAFGSPRFVKEFGLATAAGLALELFVVQALVAPGLLRLAARETRRQ